MTDQLNMGVRELHLDVHYFAGEIRLCHAVFALSLSLSLCLCQPVTLPLPLPLSSVLCYIRAPTLQHYGRLRTF
jgi:hypothetical protein